jgi:signal transduction histidine kinase
LVRVSRSSLRRRLTAAFAGAAAVLVILAAVALYGLTRRAFWASLDGALYEEVETLASVLDVGREHDVVALVRRIAAEQAPGPGKFVLVATADGRVVASAGRVPGVAGSTGRTGAGEAHTVWSDGSAYRVASSSSAGGLVCTVGVRVQGGVAALRRARWEIAGIAILLIGGVSFLGWAVTARATGELDRLTRELETVEAGALDRRLTPRSTVEVDRLVAVLNRLLERLASAMASLRRFTADAAHELRTPLAALRAHLELAIGALGANPPVALVDALEQSERLGRLAEDLLTLSSVEAGKGGGAEETVCLGDVVHELRQELEPIVSEQGRRIVEEIEPNVLVSGVPSLLRRLLINLLDNALRHTPPSATVRIVLAARGGRALLEVVDEGAGMKPQEAAVVFERFHRGRGSPGGSGLGLPICREIARRHGGEIFLRSIPGRGTTVRIELPLASR